MKRCQARPTRSRPSAHPTSACGVERLADHQPSEVLKMPSPQLLASVEAADASRGKSLLIFSCRFLGWWGPEETCWYAKRPNRRRPARPLSGTTPDGREVILQLGPVPLPKAPAGRVHTLGGIRAGSSQACCNARRGRSGWSISAWGRGRPRSARARMLQLRWIVRPNPSSSAAMRSIHPGAR